MKNILFFVLALSVCLHASCVADMEWEEGDSNKNIKVRFDLRTADAVRSSISPDEDVVDDFNVYVYCRGLLVGNEFSERLTSVAFELDYGQQYNVYVLANMGYVEPFLYQDDLLNYAYSVSEISEFGKFLPLAGCLTNVVPRKSDQRFSVQLERLVSKIQLSVDKSSLSELSIRSVRLCQSALGVYPFAENLSAVVSEEDVDDGDYCTASDLQALNKGESVCFYALENLQGVLLPDNDDPWKKIPKFLEGKADLCTYLEVGCVFSEQGLYDGVVTYRIYLGQDNCKDFNIVRNSILDVSLFLTVDGIKKDLSWRVSADYALRDGHVSGWVSRGRHYEDDLYVGERFEYSVWLSGEMAEYLGTDIETCEVYFRSFDGEEDGQVRFTGLVQSDESEYCLEALCMKPSAGEICIRNKDGQFLAVLSDNVCINIPSVQISDSPFAYDDEMVSSVSRNMLCEINGDIVSRYVYFVDSECINLNVSSGCGYDLSVFDFDLNPYLNGDSIVVQTVDLSMEVGDNCNDGPALICSLTCVNNGRSHRTNVGLLNANNQTDCLSWRIGETVCGIDEMMCADIRSMYVELTLVDNGWAGYGTTQLAMVVNNPSRLPLSVECWQLITVNLQYDSSLKSEAVNKVENELDLISMEYVVNQYNESSLPVYGSSSSFVSELNEFGSTCLEKGELLIYNLQGLDTDDIVAALTYGGWGYDSMSHHLCVSFTDGSDIAELTVTDNLSGGISSYIRKYNYNGLNDRGIWLYDSDSLILAPEKLFDSYPGLNPFNIRTLRGQTPVVGTMTYDKNAARLYISADALGADGLVLDSQSEAEADGYVQTYPDGTWGKAVDNYCHEELTKICTDFPVRHSGNNIIADNNTVRHIFEQIYENTYYDSWNKIGSSNSYWHSAHPTSLSMKMSFKLSDENDKGAYRFTPLFPKYVVFKHAQEGTEYSVPVDFTYSTYKFVQVTEK